MAPLTHYEDKERILHSTTFMIEITDALLVELEDYHESVRE